MISKNYMEAKYRMALSRMKLALEELEFLESHGCETPSRRLKTPIRELSSAIDATVKARDKAAQRFCFEPREGMKT